MNKIELIENYIRVYKANEYKIHTRLNEFSQVPRKQYFYELIYCICTPMSKAENALQVQKILQESNFIDHPFNPVEILSKREHYIRFHNQKSRYILQNFTKFNEILAILDTDVDNFTKRNMLAKKVVGFNLKESSHFLRNIGYKGLAILDRHILRNLKLLGIIEQEYVIKSWNDYFKVEENFKIFAHELQFDSDILDLVLWANETGKVIK